MLRTFALLLLLPMDVSPKPADSWSTIVTVMLFASNHANTAYFAKGSGVEAAPIQMPARLSNWTCRRDGRDRGDEVTSYVECRAGDATVVIDVTCKKGESDADIGSAILLNKARNYGGRFVVTCMTAAQGHETEAP